jgi:integrase
MRLTNTAIQATKPRDRAYKLSDGRGLHLLVTSAGGRLWRFRYRYAGKENMLGLGLYPEVTLQDARERREEARRLLAQGIDPSAQRQAIRHAASHTVEGVVREWLNRHRAVVTPEAYVADSGRLEKFILPALGSRPIGEVAAPELLVALRKIEARGTHEIARRTQSLCGRIWRYAVATGRAQADISASLKGTLTPPESRSFAALTEPAKVGALLRAIDGYHGHPVTAHALRLAPLVFVRPGELRAAEWNEFSLDCEEPEWRIPGERMKMGEQHVVPLSRQAVTILRELRPLTGVGRFVFPGLRTNSRPLSENTLNAALRRLGYSNEEMTAHGFRAMASTLLNEQGFPPDIIELQLAHAERNKVRAAYNRAMRIPERRQMMQAWAHYLDKLKANTAGVEVRATG